MIDLYGQCSQVLITTGSEIRPTDNHIMTADLDPILTALYISLMFQVFTL